MCLLAGESPKVLATRGMVFCVMKMEGSHHCEYSWSRHCQCLAQDPDFFLVNTFDIRNLFGMGMGGTLSDDIGSLTELTVLWVSPSKVLLCFTIYIRPLNHSLSGHCFAEICPQTEILAGHCQLPLGSWLSLNLCKLRQFLLRTEGPMLILSYTLLITIFIFIHWFCRALIGCSFSGPVPSELGNLSQLTFL